MCTITVSVLWWHPDATHCLFVFDRHLYKSLWVGEAVPAPPLLLLLSCRDCAFHSSAIKADGCLQSPRQRDRWAPLPTHSYPHNYKQALADLAYFLVWNQSKKKTLLWLSFLLQLGNLCKPRLMQILVVLVYQQRPSSGLAIKLSYSQIHWCFISF